MSWVRVRFVSLFLAPLIGCALPGCAGQDDDERAVAPDAFQPSVGRIASNRALSDETGPHRYLTVVWDGQDDTALLTALAAQARRGGWSRAACVTAAERCFRNGTHFMAMVGRQEAEQPHTPGYLVPARRLGSAEVELVITPDYVSSPSRPAGQH